MTILLHGGDRFVVTLAETSAQRGAIFAFRARQYAELQPYLRAEDDYDARSYLFACTRAGEELPVATCRFTVAEAGRFELDDLTASWRPPPVPRERLVETSRVVVDRSERASGLVLAMLLAAGSFVLAETTFRWNFAVCARPLARLYARLGMKRAAEEELTLAGRPKEKRYVVIYGDMAEARAGVARSLSALGWELAMQPKRRTAT